MPLGNGGRESPAARRDRLRVSRAGALLAFEGPDQQFDLARPAEQKEAVGARRRSSTGVKAATIGMTASAPDTSARSRSTVPIGNRSLTFGVTSTTPMSAAWVSDGPNESNGRASSNLSTKYSEDHRYSKRDADNAEQRPAPVGDQRGEMDPPKRNPAGAQSLHHHSPAGVADSTATARPSTRCSSREP